MAYNEIKLAEIQKLLDTEQLPEGVSYWFVRCALATFKLDENEKLDNIHRSFQESQPMVLKKVDTTFAWFKSFLETNQ